LWILHTRFEYSAYRDGVILLVEPHRLIYDDLKDAMGDAGRL
jgi:hypothetical protein